MPAVALPRASAHIALVTAAAARNLDEDLPPLEAALGALPGMQFSIVDWDDDSVDWTAFDLALLRSTWDYTQRLEEFLDWITRAAASTTLLNPLAVVRWNTDKHYLHDLAQAGVATVPSVFIEPDRDAADALRAFLLQQREEEFVVKPAIGAGSRDAQRYSRRQADAAVEHARRLLADRRSVLLQPYLDRVDESGETALVFFGGQFSHAIRKGPLLRRGEGPTRALFATEHIMPRIPDDDELRLANQTLAAMPVDAAAAEGRSPLLYARVDLIRAADGSPRVLELELTEPSLFFDHAPGAAARFARTVAERALAAKR
jgi:glutathione synthase/RimK-type ligase-like ATP-grasp enzyme